MPDMPSGPTRAELKAKLDDPNTPPAERAAAQAQYDAQGYNASASPSGGGPNTPPTKPPAGGG